MARTPVIPARGAGCIRSWSERGVREDGGRKTAMIYYPPQILFLRRARQLRSRSSIFFPFTAHRATLLLLVVALPYVPFSGTRRNVSPFARPLCSAPSLKVTDCLLYYPLVSIFTLLSEARPVSIVPAANSYGHNTVLKDSGVRIIVAMSSVSAVIVG